MRVPRFDKVNTQQHGFPRGRGTRPGSAAGLKKQEPETGRYWGKGTEPRRTVHVCLSVGKPRVAGVKERD